MNDRGLEIGFSDIARDSSMKIFHCREAEFVEQAAAGRARISGDLFNHAVNSLRMKPGEKFVVSVKPGPRLFICSPEETGRNGATVSAERIFPRDDSALCDIECYLGAIKGQRGDDAVEKLTELGVSGIYFFEAERSVAGFDGKKAARLEKIAMSASGQSRRYSSPDVGIVSYGEIFERAFSRGAYCLLMAEPGIAGNDLASASAGSGMRRIGSDIQNLSGRPVFIISGPEGGLSSKEMLIASRASAEAEAGKSPARIVAATLGNTVFRAELAPVVMVSVIKFLCGDFGA